jgi:hypothetical protein
MRRAGACPTRAKSDIVESEWLASRFLSSKAVQRTKFSLGSRVQQEAVPPSKALRMEPINLVIPGLVYTANPT